MALPAWRRRCLGMIRPCYKPFGNLLRDRQSPARPLAHGAFGIAYLPGQAPLGPIQQGKALAKMGGGHGVPLKARKTFRPYLAACSAVL